MLPSVARPRSSFEQTHAVFQSKVARRLCIATGIVSAAPTQNTRASISLQIAAGTGRLLDRGETRVRTPHTIPRARRRAATVDTVASKPRRRRRSARLQQARGSIGPIGRPAAAALPSATRLGRPGGKGGGECAGGPHLTMPARAAGPGPCLPASAASHDDPPGRPCSRLAPAPAVRDHPLSFSRLSGTASGGQSRGSWRPAPGPVTWDPGDGPVDFLRLSTGPN